MGKWIGLVLILVSLMACSREDDFAEGERSVSGEAPERMETEVICPVHQIPVFKVQASPAIHCYVWDPKLDLTVEQIRDRYPYAIWDSNLYREDETPGSKFPRYNLICDRCQDSWVEYVEAHRPMIQERKFVVEVSASGEVRIEDVVFNREQLTAVVKAFAAQNPRERVFLRVEKETPTEDVRSVAEAVKEGGVTDMVFGSLVRDQ